MKRLLDEFFGQPGRSIRKDAHLLETFDEDGNPIVIPITAESYSLSRAGSNDGVQVTAERYLHCGCNASSGPPGGQCGEPGCRRISCERCFTKSRCSTCGKPLCLEHSHALEPGGPRNCAYCHGEAYRSAVIQNLVAGLLRPFQKRQRK